MPVPFGSRAVVPADIVVRELDGEAVLLNLSTEAYYGLDGVGTRMWSLVTTAPTIEDAYDALLAEYDVSAELLRGDMEALLGDLVANGLLALEDAETTSRA